MSEITRELSQLVGAWTNKYTQFNPTGNAGNLIIPGNALRWAIGFATLPTTFAGTPSGITVCPFSASLNPTGFLLNNTLPTILFNYRDYPGWVIAPWTVMGGGTNVICAVSEIIAQQ